MRDVMSMQPITDVISKPTTTEDRWRQVQAFVSLANDLARHDAAYRYNPASGVGTRFTGLQTYVLKDRLMKTPEVQAALDQADDQQPLSLRLSHPYNLSLITVKSETPIELSDASKLIAGEVLNRIYMPRGASTMQMRARWAFRSVLLPIPARSPQD
ncbi:MAG: hypothetical protein RLZZ244_1413 [Verrucomicrobiota bacterium]|jgi:hypothetical protein